MERQQACKASFLLSFFARDPPGSSLTWTLEAAGYASGASPSPSVPWKSQGSMGSPSNCPCAPIYTGTSLPRARSHERTCKTPWDAAQGCPSSCCWAHMCKAHLCGLHVPCDPGSKWTPVVRFRRRSDGIQANRRFERLTVIRRCKLC